MFLPRGKIEWTQPEVGPGFYPSGMHQLSVSDHPEQWEVDPSRSFTHTVEAMAKVKSIGRGKKYNLMAQVIPIYGFGILLYILYIMYKLTCKGNVNKSGHYSTEKTTNISNTSAHDYELARLQEKLLRTEIMLERIVSERTHCSSSGRRRKSKASISKKEEKLLRQLRQITLLMQEGRLEGASPEMEAEEVPYSSDWEGYPEETYPAYDDPCPRHKYETIRLEEYPSQPTAEALAESMEQEEEEILARKLSIVQEEDEEEQEKEDDLDEEEEEGEVDEEVGEKEEEVEQTEEEKEHKYVEEDEEEEEQEEAERKQLLSPAPPVSGRKQEKVGFEVSKELQQHKGAKKQITFSDKRHVFHYPKEDTYEEGEEEETEDEMEEEEEEEEEEGTEVEEEDDDPLMEAESLLFSCESSSNPDEQAEEVEGEYLLTLAPVEDETQIHADVPKEVEQSGLRMRNRRER